MDTNAWLVLGVPGGLILIGLIYWAHTTDEANRKREREAEAEAERRRREADSLIATNNRNIVAAFVQRGDYIHLSDQDFASWMDLNKGHLFPHEVEAMMRHRAAQHSKKAPPDRK